MLESPLFEIENITELDFINSNYKIEPEAIEDTETAEHEEDYSEVPECLLKYRKVNFVYNISRKQLNIEKVVRKSYLTKSSSTKMQKSAFGTTTL